MKTDIKVRRMRPLRGERQRSHSAKRRSIERRAARRRRGRTR